MPSQVEIATCRGASDVEPFDDQPLLRVISYLFIGQNGDLTLTTADNEKVTLKNVPSGLLLPLQIKQVWRSGTSAGALIGFTP